jgi:hypothetical protein
MLTLEKYESWFGEQRRPSMSDPSQPDSSIKATLSDRSVVPEPSEADVLQALVDVEKATKEAHGQLPPVSRAAQSLFSRYAFPVLYIATVLSVCVAIGWTVQRIVKRLSSSSPARQLGSDAGVTPAHHVDSTVQAKSEAMLSRLASGDSAAADQVMAESDSWTGKTQRTPKTDQLLDIAINSPDLHAREAAAQALLALDGIPRDARGLKMLQDAVGDPRSRAWALWMLGALGRTLDPVHNAKIIGAYLDDTDVSVRANAVNALALIATDETVPLLLDRFRNDPSPVVQERAACGLAQAGLYTHEQRMVAAASLIGWLDDPLLSAQQKAWVVQALRDITGAAIGSDAAAWRTWWALNHHGRA